MGSTVVPLPFLLAKFKTYHRVPLLKRFALVAEDVRAYVRDATRRKLTGQEKTTIGEAIPRMFRFHQVLDLYRDFYRWLGRPELLQLDHGQPLEYADVFALIYLRLRLEGITAYDHVKHLLVDEMQDYTPVQYAVLSRLFPCRKTILGDVSQTVNPYSASSAETIERVFPQADVVKLYRSYRSTVEITAFAQRITPNPHIIPLERHGPEPVVARFASQDEELQAIKQLVAAFQGSGNQSLGIICKTLRQAKEVHQALQGPGVHLLTGGVHDASRKASSSPRPTWRRAWSLMRSLCPLPPPATTKRRWIKACSTWPAPGPCTSSRSRTRAQSPDS